MLLTGGISVTDYTVNKPNLAQKVLNSLNGALKTTLFIEALRNLNWSRGYCWYVEMDGVPNPFQRGGVLGLPCTSLNFTLAEGKSYGWESGINSLSAPQNVGGVKQMTLTLMDDEQGTLRQFFERWYNQVYNPYYGVLPLAEACKQITIYFQKSTRRNVKRVSYSIDSTLSDMFSSNLFRKRQKVSDGMDFLVFPSGSVQMSLNTGNSELITFNVTLEVAHFVNQDFGSPTNNNGVKTLFDNTIGSVTQGNSWLDKIADYI